MFLLETFNSKPEFGFNLRSAIYKFWFLTYIREVQSFSSLLTTSLHIIKVQFLWFFQVGICKFEFINFIPDTLTLFVLCISESCVEIKIKLSFYFHTSLWCLKRFYEGLWVLHKTFWTTTMKCENKNLT